LKAIVRDVDQQILTVTKVYYHPDVRADFSNIRDGLRSHPFGNGLGVKLIKSISIPLGSHVDDWISDQFILSKVLVMGYPAVPWAHSSELVTTEAEINALVQNVRVPHPITSFHQ